MSICSAVLLCNRLIIVPILSVIQMGGIDESALDRLSLVTEMTKHIRVRASGGKTTASELGQFAPIFVWLLRVIFLNINFAKLVVNLA